MACWSRVTHDWVPIDAVNLNPECDAIVQAHSEGSSSFCVELDNENPS